MQASVKYMSQMNIPNPVLSTKGYSSSFMFVSRGLETCPLLSRKYRPVPGLTRRGGGSLIVGGGDVHHRRSVNLEGSGGMLLQKSFYKFD